MASSKLIGALLLLLIGGEYLLYHIGYRYSTGRSKSSFDVLPDARHPPGPLVPSCNTAVAKMALSSQETPKNQECSQGAPNGWECIEWPGVR